MSALRMLAWGMVKLHEMTPDQRRLLHRDAKFEAHAHGYWISGCKSAHCCDHVVPDQFGNGVPPGSRASQAMMSPYGGGSEHKLTRWNRKLFSNPRRPGLSDRNKPIIVGSFAECCKELVGMIEPITPSNPAE